MLSEIEWITTSFSSLIQICKLCLSLMLKMATLSVFAQDASINKVCWLTKDHSGNILVTCRDAVYKISYCTRRFTLIAGSSSLGFTDGNFNVAQWISHKELYLSPNRAFSLLNLVILYFACWTSLQAMSQHWMHVEILKRVVNPGVSFVLIILSTSAAKPHQSRSFHVSESALLSCENLIVLIFVA